MIRLFPLDQGLGDVVPQAIFWRPLQYFTCQIREAHDDLDAYRYGTFEVGNWLRFDLRHYAGHPPFTATMYLPLEMDEPSDIQHAIARSVGEFNLPSRAVAWKRGEPFQYGELVRREGDRLREPEARILVLKVAAQMPNKTATTDQLIEGATELFSPSQLDLLPSRTRPRQPQWHQIIRNVISHRQNASGPFARGLAVRTANGLSVTDEGLVYLRHLGYLV